MPYSDNKTYAKYLKEKCIQEESDCGCSDNCNDNECSCCPPGLVAVYDTNGVHQGCLTPGDAELFHASTFTCKDGYVKLYKNGETPVFLGCVSETEFAELYAAVNP